MAASSVDTKNTASKVSERLMWLEGKTVTVRVSYAEIGGLGGETFVAVYRDVAPMGREYFWVFEVAGRARLVRSTSVVEVIEVDHGRGE